MSRKNTINSNVVSKDLTGIETVATGSISADAGIILESTCPKSGLLQANGSFYVGTSLTASMAMYYATDEAPTTYIPVEYAFVTGTATFGTVCISITIEALEGYKYVLIGASNTAATIQSGVAMMNYLS